MADDGHADGTAHSQCKQCVEVRGLRSLAMARVPPTAADKRGAAVELLEALGRGDELEVIVQNARLRHPKNDTFPGEVVPRRGPGRARPRRRHAAPVDRLGRPARRAAFGLATARQGEVALSVRRAGCRRRPWRRRSRSARRGHLVARRRLLVLRDPRCDRDHPSGSHGSRQAGRGRL